MDIRKLLATFDALNEGSMADAKKKPRGPKFPGYLKGTDPASLTHSRMVGSSESQENVLKDLEQELVEGAVERKLKEEFAEFDTDLQQLDELNLFRKKPKPEPVKVPDEDYRQLFNKDPVSFSSHHPLDVKHFHNSRDYYEKTGINPLDAKRPVKELAPPGGGDNEEDPLKYSARLWWNGNEEIQLQVERDLAQKGWEIGEDEGSYKNGGVFVVRAGDENGKSYQSWPAEELTEGVAEGIFGSKKEPEDKKEKLTLAAMRKIEQELADKQRQDPKYVRSNDLPKNPDHRRTVTDDKEKKSKIELPPAENSRKTQIAGTLPTYKKAADILSKTGVKGKALDFGAGLGHGTKELGVHAHSYEPFPGGKFKPHFVEVTDIPDNAYHKIVNLNVLNVVPNAGKQRVRDSIVQNIGRVLAPGGVAIITTRGKDVLTIKGTPGEEPMSMISKIGTYQKGFTATELQEYVQNLLGDEFTVSKIKLGPAGIMIKKHKTDTIESQTPGNEFLSKEERVKHGDKVYYKGKFVGIATGKVLDGKILFTPAENYGTSRLVAGLPSDVISLHEADDDMFAPSDRAADQVAASKWRRGGEISGSSLKGYIETTYRDLLSVFGEPIYGPDADGDKTTCEWVITFKDGKVGTIYDYNTTDTPGDLYDWHIGGNSPKVVDYIRTLMTDKGKVKLSQWDIFESVGSTVDLTKNYSNYNSVKGEVIEISPKGRLKIRITTADIDQGRRAAVRVGDVINVASNYVKKGMSEDSAMETRIYNTERVNVYYKPYPNSRHSRVVAENIPSRSLDALLEKLANKFGVSTTDFVWHPTDDNKRLDETSDEYVIFVNGKPAAKYRSLDKAYIDARMLQSKHPDEQVEIKHEVCTMQPMEEEQIDEVGMTTGGMAGMTSGGTQAQPTQPVDPAQAAKDLTTAQQNLNKLKSAGIALPTGVSQAAKTVMGVTNNPTAPQTPADRKTTGALGQGIEQLLAKGDPGQVNQLAAMIKKVQQGGPQ